MGADRCQGDGTKIVVDDARDAAGPLVRLDRAVHIGQAVVDVGAGHLVVPPRRQRRILLGHRLQCGSDPEIELGAAFRLLNRIVTAKADGQLVAGGELQLATDRFAVDRILIDLLNRIIDVSVTPAADDRQADRQDILDQWARRGAPELPQVVTAVGGLRDTLKGIARVQCGDVQRAGGRVLAKQRALRPAQHLDLADIVEVERRRGRP